MSTKQTNHGTITCDVCGQSQESNVGSILYNVEIPDKWGYYSTQSVDPGRLYAESHHACPDCWIKVTDFIETITKKSPTPEAA